jgi:hypothetical protein
VPAAYEEGSKASFEAVREVLEQLQLLQFMQVSHSIEFTRHLLSFSQTSLFFPLLLSMFFHQVFRENLIDYSVLLMLSPDHLKELGLPMGTNTCLSASL